MQFKKIVLSLILFSGILGCDCFNGGTAWNITDFTVTMTDKQENTPLNGIIEGDSVRLILTFEAEFVALNANPLKGLMTSAYSTSCEEPGDDGLEDKITALTVTSNADFNAIPAGASLNELLIANQKNTIEEWIAQSDTWMFKFENQGGLMFVEKPEPSSIHIFTVKIRLASGKVIEQKTEEIQWN